MGCKKQGAKKKGHCYSKREEAVWPLFFLKTNAMTQFLEIEQIAIFYVFIRILLPDFYC